MNGYKSRELRFASVPVLCVLVCLNETVLCVRLRSGGQNFFFSSFRTRHMYLDLEICQFLICTHRITERKTSHAVAEAQLNQQIYL